MIIKPNWQQPFKITYEFATEILTSRKGREQRIAQRITPRKTLEYRVLAHGPDHRRIHRLIAAQQHALQSLPEVTRKIKGVAPVLSGDTQFLVNAALAWIYPGQLVFIEDELNSVVSITPSGGNYLVELAVPVVADRPAGFRVFQGVVGYMEQSQNVDQDSNAVAQISFKFNVQPGSEVDQVPPAATVFFNGREVFTKRPNWRSPPAVTYSRMTETLDYGRGLVEHFNPVSFGTLVMDMTFLARNVQEADDILNMYTRNLGRQGEFYMSTGLQDIVINTNAPSGTSTLVVSSAEFADDFADDTTRRAVCVELDNGTVIYNKLLNIEDVGQNSVLTFATPWPTNLTMTNVAAISWLQVWRFASDSLSIEWVTDSVAQYKIAMQTLEDIPV